MVVRELVANRVKEMNTNMAEVSRRLGLSHSYLQQYIKRHVPARLPEDVRSRLADILQIPEDALRESAPPRRVPQGNTILAIPKAQVVKQLEPFAPNELPLRVGNAEMPLYRFAQGGETSPILDQVPFESVPRPVGLEKVRDPYGVMVEGISMSPEFEPGWIAHVNPTLTPKAGDTCIFRGELADGSHVALIKRLAKETATQWIVTQHYPPANAKKPITLKKDEYKVAHVVTGSDRRRR